MIIKTSTADFISNFVSSWDWNKRMKIFVAVINNKIAFQTIVMVRSVKLVPRHFSVSEQQKMEQTVSLRMAFIIEAEMSAVGFNRSDHNMTAWKSNLINAEHVIFRKMHCI